jgi:hypothetical protein
MKEKDNNGVNSKIVVHEIESHNNNSFYHVKIKYHTKSYGSTSYLPGFAKILNSVNNNEMKLRGIRYKKCGDKSWIDLYKHIPDAIFGIDWGTNAFDKEERKKLNAISFTNLCPLTIYYVYEEPFFFSWSKLINTDGSTIMELHDDGYGKNQSISLSLLVSEDLSDVWSYE